MPKLFAIEQQVLSQLLDEWYEAQHDFSEKADQVFSEKGQLYDKVSPVWERIDFPMGFIQELRKKTDRLRQLLSDYDPTKPFANCGVDWAAVMEELLDIHNYSRMEGGIILMKGRERGG